MEKLFKIGVSNWTLYFKTGEIVKFDTVLNHTVSIYQDKSVVEFDDACFNSEFIDLFWSGNKLDRLVEDFELVSSENNKVKTFQYEYLVPEIKSTKIKSSVDGVATITVLLECVMNYFPK
jgi:hypothetical protein